MGQFFQWLRGRGLDGVKVEKLCSMRLKVAAKKMEDGIEETLTYCDFPSEHWTRIRTNNVIERLNRDIRRCNRVVGSFRDGNPALVLVRDRLRHVAGTQWGNKKYMGMKHLRKVLADTSVAGEFHSCQRLQINLHKTVGTINSLGQHYLKTFWLFRERIDG